jgi:glycerophosphoryl diester phosphodiesterase
MMWKQARAIAADAVRDFLRSWRSLTLADLGYKTVAFALLTPVTVLLFRWLVFSKHTKVVADADILRFFVTTRVGVVALVVVGAVILAISALELACLMAIGLAAAKGTRLSARDAIVFGATRAPNVLRLTVNVVLRLLGGVVPFLVLLGFVYWALLTRHDINYYLAERPPAFWAAAAIAALVLAALAILLVWTVARWMLALPLVLFEEVSPRRALGESARRSAGYRSLIVVVIAAWSVVGPALATVARFFPEIIGRSAAPHLAGSLTLLLLLIAVLALLWGAFGLAVSVVSVSLLALVVVRLYLRVGEPREPRLPETADRERPGAAVLIPRRVKVGMAAVAALAVVSVALLNLGTSWRNQEVVVIAHRGASLAAPQNTQAAFRLAIEQGTDFVELDVQESADGEVLVVHDSDLMNVAGIPLEIWDTPAATIRSVDIGSHAGPRYSGERVLTLAEALALCKGSVGVVIELKSYGHNQRLEDKVVAIVEAAGMGNECLYMSLDHQMVWKMKHLRPSWRVGVLAAKALGDIRKLDVDFLAVEARMATPRFVRRAHRAGQDVYVWTVNDPAWMLNAMSRGVDGLITDRPDLARQVIARRARMSDAERVAVALLIRVGARTEALAAEGALQP